MLRALGLRPGQAASAVRWQAVTIAAVSLAMFPLLHFTSSGKRMGRWKSGWLLLAAGWTSAVLITAMDIYGLPDSLKRAWHVIMGG